MDPYSSFKDWVISLLFFIGLLVAKSLASHAAGSTHEIIAVFMDFLHLLAASIWLGTLFSLIFLLPRGQRTVYWHSIHRFSFWAMIAVAIILLTGIYGSIEYISYLSVFDLYQLWKSFIRENPFIFDYACAGHFSLFQRKKTWK